MTTDHPEAVLDQAYSGEGATATPWIEGRGQLEKAEIYLSMVLVSVLISGCGGSPIAGPSQSSPAASVPAACSIVTAADVSGAFNRQFPNGTTQSSLGAANDGCLFVGKDGIVAVEIAGGEGASRLYASAQQKVAGLAPTPGVGDQALLEPDGTAIVAIKGHIGVFITALLNDETAGDLSTGCVRLAKLVFSRAKS
jgi:hypothetical protein